MALSGLMNDDLLHHVLPHPAKLPTLHIENKDFFQQSDSLLLGKSQLRLPTVTERPIDTPLGTTPITERSEASSYQSQLGSRASIPEPKPSDKASSSPNSLRIPTLIHNYPPEPKLQTTDTSSSGGQESAAWRRSFIPHLHAAYGSLPPTERTAALDHLVHTNKDRYTSPIAAYYTEYPQHLPDDDLRPPCAAKQRKLTLALEGGADYCRPRQQRLFRDWDWETAGRREKVKGLCGPRGESEAGEGTGECRHCVKAARREERRRVWEPIVGSVAMPIRTLKRAASRNFARTRGEAEMEGERKGVDVLGAPP